tara:strand:+ start:34 stop:972 length:939 start_codon:yes stop_codon:yes gene_type:complete
MTYIDGIINKNPIKYDSLIRNNISNKELKMKIDEYNNIQEEYASLLSNQSVNQSGWNDLQNTNYSSGLITQPKSENDMWKYLGQADTLEDCKLQSVQDKQPFKSVVYYPEQVDNGWAKSCYGGINSSKPLHQVKQKHVITSIPPNKSTALGGEVGFKLLTKMKNIQDDIQSLIQQQTTNTQGIIKSKSLFKVNINNQELHLDEVIEKLKSDRVELDKVLNATHNNEYIAYVEESNLKKTSTFYHYILWFILAVITIYMSIHLYSSEYYNISTSTYLFVTAWIVIFLYYYHSQISEYSGKISDSISYLFSMIP